MTEKKRPEKIRWILCITLITVFVIFSLFTFRNIVDNATAYQRVQRDYASLLNFEDRLLNPSEWLDSDKEWAVKETAAQKKIEDASVLVTENQFHILTFSIVSLLFFISIMLIFFTTTFFRKSIALSFIIIGLACLFAGISIPALEIAAFKENLHIPIQFKVPVFGFDVDFSKTFDGKMYFYYQSKSVMDLIEMLFDAGNYIVSIAILLFSIVLPATKMTLSLILLFKDSLKTNLIITTIVNNIGKWSMADVFVAAMFLAFLSFNNMNTGIETESRVLPGLWFFFSYCIFSLVSTHFLGIKKKY